MHISRPLVNIFMHSCTFSGLGCAFSNPRRTFSGAHFWAPGPHFQGHVADIFLLDIINQTEYPPFKRNQLAEGARPRWTPRCGIVWERSEECHPRRPPPALHWYHTGLRIMSPPHRPRVPQTPRKTLIHINRDSLLSFETSARLPSPNSKLNKSWNPQESDAAVKQSRVHYWGKQWSVRLRIISICEDFMPPLQHWCSHHEDPGLSQTRPMKTMIGILHRIGTAPTDQECCPAPRDLWEILGDLWYTTTRCNTLEKYWKF